MQWYVIIIMKTAPKYIKIRDWLLDIATNPDNSAEVIPSERQICKILKMSRHTVRKGINSLIEEGVLESKQGMGTFINRKVIKEYQPEPLEKLTIGIVIFNGERNFQLTHYVWGIIEPAINILSRKGFRVQFISLENPKKTIPGKPKWILKARQIISNDIAGLIWIGPGEEQELIDLLRENDISTLVVGNEPVNKKTDYIISDDFHGGFIAGEHLIKHGHYNILFATRDTNRVFTEARFSGFQQALLKYNIEQDPSLILNNLNVEEVYYTLREKLRTQNNFTGIFVADGIYLNAIYHAIRDEGKKIPDDISIISYDQSKAEDFPGVKITEVWQPLLDMGTLAANKLFKIIKKQQNGTIQSTLKPTMKKGNTVCTKK